MRLAATIALVVAITAGCSKPGDIIFGPEPLKQIAEQGDQFKKLSEEDRTLLVAYLGIAQMSKVFGAEVKSPTGRTVAEVLVDANAWRGKVKTAEADAKKREAESEALKVKVLAERKAVAERISSSVVRCQRRQAPVVEDQQLDTGEALEQTSIASVAACEGERVHQARHAPIERRPIVPARLVAERAGEPALAGA